MRVLTARCSSWGGLTGAGPLPVRKRRMRTTRGVRGSGCRAFELWAGPSPRGVRLRMASAVSQEPVVRADRGDVHYRSQERGSSVGHPQARLATDARARGGPDCPSCRLSPPHHRQTSPVPMSRRRVPGPRRRPAPVLRHRRAPGRSRRVPGHRRRPAPELRPVRHTVDDRDGLPRPGPTWHCTTRSQTGTSAALPTCAPDPHGLRSRPSTPCPTPRPGRRRAGA